MQELMLLLHALDEKEHKSFPYNLFETLCVNTGAMGVLISSLMTMLICGLDYHAEKRCSGEVNIYEAHKFKECKIEVLMVVTTLHLMGRLTRIYSVSRQFLGVNDRPSCNLEVWLRPSQKEVSSLELLLQLLPKTV